MDADVFINETHVIETWYPDEARFRRTIYVCREQRGSRYMMARLTVDGWYRIFVFYCVLFLSSFYFAFFLNYLRSAKHSFLIVKNYCY